jgi:hypothetical protein
MLNITEMMGGEGALEARRKENYMMGLRVAMPGIIESYDAVTQTVTVRPALTEWLHDEIGNAAHIRIPSLPDVPLVLPRAGNYALTLPVSVGDEVLIVFADMCIDAWWQSGDVQNQIEKRRHDLSDAFAILGTWSQPRRLPALSLNSACLMNVQTGMGLEVTASGVNVQGNLAVAGDIAATGSLNIGGNISVTGNAGVGGSLTVSGGVGVGGVLSVTNISGNVNVTGSLSVNGTAVELV